MHQQAPVPGRFQRFVEAIVDGSAKNPFVVLLLTIAFVVGGVSYAKRIELRTDFLELLPRDSPGFKAYEHQLGRVGGGASLIVIVDSPDPKANERFIDGVNERLTAKMADHAKCVATCGLDQACVSRCGPQYISYIEAGTKDVHSFYESQKWLYADLKDLEDADNTLDHQIAIKSGLISDLDDDSDADGGAPTATSTGDAGAASATSTSDAGAASIASSTNTNNDAGAPVAVTKGAKPTLGMDGFRDRWDADAKKHDDFPTGYFATKDGRMHGLRIISMTTGMGDAGGETLVRQVEGIIHDLNPKSFHPEMDVGLAGDIPNAQDEKDSLMSDALVATVVTFLLILAGIAFYFRSVFALPIIGIPAIVGVTAAYSFAMAAFGYVNTAGLFLGAIILGNGINYPIVLLARYKEFRARGQEPAEARRGAVWNAFRAELVGALVAAIAYGSLTVTRFRGFSQFGMIGFVGMLLVWLSMIPIVPALIVLTERLGNLITPASMKAKPSHIAEDGTSGPMMRFASWATSRAPGAFVIGALLLMGFAASRLPAFLRDPWEYNMSHLGSRSSKQTGAAKWSNKADDVFGGKMNIAGAMMLADSPQQVPLLKEQILKNDKQDPQGTLVNDVATIADLMPGTAEEQKAKLAVLDRIRDRLTPKVLSEVSDEERKKLEDLDPPESLRILETKDMPSLLRRRFEESNGTIGTVFYVKFKDLVFSDGHNALRIAKTTDNVKLADGTVVQTASRSTVFAEMIRSMERDGPLATGLSFALVVVVVVIATSSKRGAFAVLASLLMGVVCMLGGAALFDVKLNFLNFIALPITFGIGCEYPFNIFDRSRLLGGDISLAVRRSGGAVALCSYTTTLGYGALLFNDNQALQSFGTLAMAGEIACLAGAIFVLPSILHLLNRYFARPTSRAPTS